MQALDVLAAAPVAAVASITILMLIGDLFGFAKNRLLWTLLACFSGLLFSFPQSKFSTTAFSGLVYVDGFSWICSTIILLGAAATFMLSHNLWRGQRASSSIDVDVLMLMAVIGGMVMVSAAHFILLFIGFELLSIAVYVLAGIARGERASSEGALKYFILGAFSSAFLLYGMVLVYGATGSMQLSQIAAAISADADNAMLIVGIGLIIFGFGFKVSLVPFHVWTPDVYQGAPVSVTSFMAVVVKAAAFASFVRLMNTAFGDAGQHWIGLLWALSVVTMTLGNLAALRQQSIKRLLAYSSIAHAGYALIGFLTLSTSEGMEATVFYLIAYSLMTAAAFGVVLLVSAGTQAQYDNDDIESLAGVGWSQPFLGLVMTIAMLSLAGFPPLAGFVGKFYLFKSAVEGGFIGLVIIAAINSVISMYYYLRVLVVMYFHGERESEVESRDYSTIIPSFAPRFALALLTVGTIYFGLFGEVGIKAVAQATSSL